uniref:ABC transporter permease n=1 Tax=Actinomyces vulturis TaxID=1857645 RepID=UPI000830A42F|nr:ABC transporter permease [Actinomyces vulturis]
MSVQNDVWIVTRREFRTQFLKKANLISMVVMAVLAVVGILGFHFFLGDDEPDKVGFPSDEAASVYVQVAETQGMEIEPVTITKNEALRILSGDNKDDDPELTMFVDTEAEPVQMYYGKNLPTQLSAVLSNVASQQILAQELTAEGVDLNAYQQAVSNAQPEIISAQPDVHEGRGERMFAAMLVLIALFVIIMTGGNMIAMGVMEEKSSRIIEILLATVKPSTMIVGKTVGAVGSVLLTYVLIAIPPLVTAKVIGLGRDLPFPLGSTLIIAFAWLLVGVAMYSLLYAAAGSLVERQEDLGSAIMPLMALLFAPYIVAFSLMASNPESVILTVLSYFPLTAPLAMPVRYALDVTTLPMVVLSLVIAVATIPLLVWVCGRIYRGAILRTGGRVKLKDAFKG